MTQKLFTLAEDCEFEGVELNKGDIMVVVPTPAENIDFLDFLEEEEVEYDSLFSIYFYPKQDIVEALLSDSCIFCKEPKYATLIHSDYLPDVFFDLPIEATEIVVGVDLAEEN